MNSQTSFKIFNSSDYDMEIIHEPESFTYYLPVNEEVIVECESCRESIQLNVSLDNGKIVVSIFDENSLYTVLHNGKNVFEKYL